MIEKIDYEFIEIPKSDDDFENQEELIAVITAAIAACLNRSTHSIVVRSIRQTPTVSSAWNRAARLNLTASWF